jgi:hypothetical protein
MPTTSFSCMAYISAPRCLDHIRRFMDAYRIINLADNSTPDPNCQNALETMKRGALKFAVLEDQTALETSNSDLDEIVAECRIVNAAEPSNPLFEDCPAESLSTISGAYESLLLDVLSFVQTMDKVYDFPRSPASREVKSGMRNAFGQAWMANKMEHRVRLVGIQLAAWDKIEEHVQICRDWYKIHPGLHEKALKIAQAEYAAEADKLRSQNKTFRKITAILEAEEPTVRLKIRSAHDLPKAANWRSYSKLPSPFARLHTSQEELCRTDTVQKTVSPLWTAPWAYLPLSPANPYYGTKAARITISTSTSDGCRLNIAHTRGFCLDSHSSRFSQAGEPSHRAFKSHSLYEAFSGKYVCRYIWQS